MKNELKGIKTKIIVCNMIVYTNQPETKDTETIKDHLLVPNVFSSKLT